MAKKKEVRQRGKKRKAVDEDARVEVQETEGFVIDRTGAVAEAEAAPSWLLEKPTSTDDSTPFGLVDADLKAYLRSAHVSLQEKMDEALQEERVPRNDDEVKTLRNAMLDEVKSKELVLATDTDTSVILEGMLVTFGERQIRIICDALEREAATLATHRFGSHVLQSCIVALQPYISDADEEAASESSLRSAQKLVLDITAAVGEKGLDVVQNQFGTHIIRTMLLVLSGRRASEQGTRSKRSSKFKQKNENGFLARTKGEPDGYNVPPSFKKAKGVFIEALKQALCAEEALLRSMCVDPVSGPTLALLVELEDRHAAVKGSDLLNKCLGGLMDRSDDERSAHVETLLRDSVGSHVLESVVKSAEATVIARFWTVYIQDRFLKLAAHPTANFVLASLIRRLNDRSSFQTACKAIAADEDGTVVESGHLGIFTALLACASAIDMQERSAASNGNNAKATFWTASRAECLAVRAIMDAFGVNDPETLAKVEEKVDGGFVALLLQGKTVASSKAQRKKERIEAKRGKGAGGRKAHPAAEAPPARVTLQGSLLCQSIARLAAPASEPLIDSLLNSNAFLRICSDQSGVHVVLAALQSAQLAFSYRTRLSATSLEHIEALLNDKYGSRVVDATFDRADLYFKDKIARRCLAIERPLLASTYGRYFLKKVQIALYRRDNEAWKREMRNRQAPTATTAEAKASAVAETEVISKKRKVTRAEDELDEILAEMD